MVGASSKVATAAAVVSVNGDANQRGIFFATGQAATARHRMWPEVMSVASAKFGGDPFTQAGLGPVAGPGSFPDGRVVEPDPPASDDPSPTPDTPSEPQSNGNGGDGGGGDGGRGTGNGGGNDD
jgi:hypothetical protein